MLKERVQMLVLTRKLGESIAIDDHIKIRVVQIKGKQVRLGIEAPATRKSTGKRFMCRSKIKIKPLQKHLPKKYRK
jgi:hypothetical protein